MFRRQLPLFSPQWALLVCAVAATSSCIRRVKSDDGAAPSATPAVESGAPVAAIAPSPAAISSPSEGCMVDESKPTLDSSERITKDPKTGKRVTQVGRDVTVKGPVTPITELMAHPEKYRDKSVKVGGKVVAMCGHRRGWFAIADSDPQNPPLRILTAPAFLVPADAMGQRAIAEGSVTVREMSEQAANHLAQGHGLPKERKVILIQAQGARFE